MVKSGYFHASAVELNHLEANKEANNLYRQKEETISIIIKQKDIFSKLIWLEIRFQSGLSIF